MEKIKTYPLTRFSPEVIREAWDTLLSSVSASSKQPAVSRFYVALGEETWDHDSEDQFFADYRRSSGSACYKKTIDQESLEVWAYSDRTETTVEARERRTIEAVFDVFEAHVHQARNYEPPPNTQTLPENWQDPSDA